MAFKRRSMQHSQRKLLAAATELKEIYIREQIICGENENYIGNVAIRGTASNSYC